jgi:tetratricopeptide (TPR) repeat protein
MNNTTLITFNLFTLRRYGEAIVAQPSNDILRALYSNCSLAYAKALRFQDALDSADKAIQSSPTWAKGYWRRGAALIGLQNIPAAVNAFLKCWELQPQDVESYRKLFQSIKLLKRDQLGAAILEIFSSLEEEKKLKKAVVEAVDLAAMKEAAFRLIADSHRGHPPPGPYYSTLLRWKTQGVDSAEAYAVRAVIYQNAKCFLQARNDAEEAIQLLLRKLGQSSFIDGGVVVDCESPSEGKMKKINRKAMFSTKEEVLAGLGAGYSRLGDAYLAEPKHPDRDPIGAFKSFTKAIDYDPFSQDLRDKLQQATEELTKEQVEKAAFEIYNQPQEDFSFGGHVSTFGAHISSIPQSVGELRPGERIFRVEATLAFPQATPGKLNSKIREKIRKALATQIETSVPTSKIHQSLSDVKSTITSGTTTTASTSGISAVTFEGVFPARPPTRPALEISIHILVGPRLLHGNTLVKILQSKDLGKIQAAIGGDDVVAALGAPNAELCRAELVDVTPTYVDATTTTTTTNSSNGEINNSGQRSLKNQETQLAIPSKPKLDLEVPYKMYRLVTSNGTAVERTDKHPFAMSRVYYDASEKPEEVWVELADGSCRWRQTAGEIRIIALKVPSDLPPRQLKVDISPYHLKIYRFVKKHTTTTTKDKENNNVEPEQEQQQEEEEIYLQGRLHRGIVPEDCFWTHCGGEGDDGCCITLCKMNLEVLQKHWAHSESWWVRLFEDHQNIAWDDYEKDYSDLPEEVLEKHRTAEAIKDVERTVEGNERHRREVLQEKDDLRKRKRQERLHVLRTGETKSWVQLHRGR